MTAKAELRAARKALGLTQHELAAALLMGKHGWQSISRWESDANEIVPPGPVMVALRYMVAFKRGDLELIDGCVNKVARLPDVD